MLTLSGVKIKVATYPDPVAIQSFFSYTLSCTPFYFKIQWFGADQDFINQFSNNQVLWDFGDGEYYTGSEASHYYKWPGVYAPKVTIYDTNGNAYNIFTDASLTVYNALPDKVFISGLENDGLVYPLLAGKKTPPITITRYNSWQYDSFLGNNNYTVNLYASGSNSNYSSVSSYYSSSWSHLKSYFGFIEEFIDDKNTLQEKLIERTNTTSVSVYAERVNTGYINNNWDVKLRFYNTPQNNTSFCGTTGTNLEGRFLRFVDQKPSGVNANNVIVLYGSVDTNIYKDIYYKKYNYNNNLEYGFVNTDYNALVIKSLYNPATAVKITSNGISVEGTINVNNTINQKNYSFDIYPIKFTSCKIPFVVTLKDGENYTTKCYPLLSLAPLSGMTVNSVRMHLVGVSLTGNSIISSALFYSNTSIPLYKNSGSYFAGLLVSPDEVQTAVISAIALVQDSSINIPTPNYGFIMQPGKDRLRRIKNTYKYGYFAGDDFNVRLKSEISTYGYTISGGINVTYAPLYLNNPDEIGYVWVTDSNREQVYLFNDNGDQLLPPLNFRNLRVLRSSGAGTTTLNAVGSDVTGSPNNIAVDSEGFAWITLRDTISSFKLDKNSMVAVRSAYPSFNSDEYYNYKFYTEFKDILSGFAGENLILPNSVDVDSQNNVYITYSHPVSSFIGKYNKDGELLNLIPFPYPYTAKNILIDLEDNIWVTTFSHLPINDPNNPQTQQITNRKDLLYYINQNDITKSFTKTFSMLGDLTMDNGGNVWVNSRNNILSRILKDGKIDSFFIGSSENPFDYIQDFGGIAGDQDGNIWIINNTEGSLQFFNAIEPQQTRIKDIPKIVLPDLEFDNVNGGLSLYTTIGDFTGLRWGLKYRIKNVNEPRYITGTSNFFTVKKPLPGLVKKNENVDLSNIMKGYVLQESLANNEILFNNFFKPILAGESGDVDELGKVIYEKISNFVDNTSDVDKCNINCLKSLYTMFGEKFIDFNYTIPPGIRRVLDTLSIKKSLLYGGKNYFNSNFVLSSFSSEKLSNLGKEINFKHGHFIPGLPIITYEIFSKKFKLVQNTLVPEKDMEMYKPYPLSAIKYDWGWGLILENNKIYKNIDSYYKFYEYVPTHSDEYFDGVIDFSDPLTTISKNITSYEDWVKFAGTMEYVIGANLYQNLAIAR